MKLLKANNIIIAMALLFSTATATDYNVSGVVQLEDVSSDGDHSGVKVMFKDISNNLVEVDSTLSSSDGTWSKPVPAGYYLVEWTKTGYVPMELGGLALGADIALTDTTIMVPGEVAEVSGAIATTTWTTSYVYYVTDDITIDAGETLTINAGVRVKFYEDKGMTVNGTLKANGTVSSPVRFTSKEPTPLPGDWANIVLNGMNNVLTYVYYEYATNGITGDNADNTTIDHLTMIGTLSLTADGIYLTNSDSLTLTNNNISTSNNYGIRANDATGSLVEGNTISAGYDNAAIWMESCDGCTFKDNTITNRPYRGIYARYSDDVLFQGNSIEVYQYGIEARDGTNHNYISNVITEFEEYGIYFYSTENCTISNNRIIARHDGGGTKYGLQNTYGYSYSDTSFNTNNTVSFGNYIEIYDHDEHSYGIEMHDSKIYNDTLKIYGSRHVRGIRSDRSSITNCYLEIEDNTTWYDEGIAIESYSGSGYRRNLIKSNTIYASRECRGIWANYADIDSNFISPGNSNTDFTETSNYSWSIGQGHYNVITNNTIVNMQQGIQADGRVDNIITNNTMSVQYWGIFASNAQGTHLYRNNVITKGYNDWFVYVTNAEDVTIDSNRFIGTGTNSSNRGIYLNNAAGNIKHNLIITPGRGIEITNQAGTSVQNNTLVSTSNGDYGMVITNLSTPSITNNIIQGYNKGIYVVSTTPQYNNTPIGPNLFYDITSDLFSGDNLPVLIGSMVDENANGHIADIYGNIIDDPLFVHADTNNYNIQAGSPAVNAGLASETDPDGSISDIGAHYYHIYVVMNHTALDHTDDTAGPYRINATISSPAGATLTGSVHYAVDGGDFTELAMTAASNDTFYADIPGQALNTTIQYYISATDGEHISVLPYSISEGGYSFFVSLFEQFANMNGSSNSDGEIELSWGTPVPITGSLTGLKLYKSTSASVALTEDNLYQELENSGTSYTDTEIAEGVTYYYKLTGTLDNDTEALVSAEVATMSNNATTVRVTGRVVLSDGNLVYYDGTDADALTYAQDYVDYISSQYSQTTFDLVTEFTLTVDGDNVTGGLGGDNPSNCEINWPEDPYRIAVYSFVSEYVLEEGGSVGCFVDSDNLDQTYEDLALDMESGDHTGVKVLMANRYLTAIRDSIVTDLTGEFDIVMQTGIYNIYFTKDGYQPNQIGNQTFPGTAGNMVLDTTDMIPGGSVVLNGEISGTLLASNIHFVDGDITVADGDTLIIQAGTVFKFRGEYELVVSGNIQALGTAEAPILFTSGMAQILPGNWKRLTLDGADHSVLQYCSFKYSTDGIYLKDNNHHTEISHCTFGNMLTNSRAITYRDYENGNEQHYSGNDSLTISYNETDAETYYGVYLRQVRGSQFVGNNFQAYYGLYCYYCPGSSFTDNTIQTSQYGMYCYDCNDASITNNEIYPFENDHIEWGLYAEQSEDIEIKNNTILGFYDRGVYINGSENSIVMNNTISDTNKQGSYRNENYVAGIDFNGIATGLANQCTIRSNNVYVIGSSDINGIRGTSALLDSNTVTAIANQDYARGIYANYSRVLDNIVYSLSNGNGRGIESHSNSSDQSTIKRNTIYALGNSRAFYGSYAHIEDNVFYGTDNNHFLWDITTATPNYNRDYWAVSSGPDLVIVNNKFYGFGYGLHINGTNSIIKNNVFTINRHQGISITSGNNTIVHKNSITLSGMNSNVEFGMRLYDNNISSVYGNTIASTESTPLGTGITIYNNASPQLNSNIVYNFATGVNAQSETYVLKFNMINGANTTMTGDGLPDQAGITATVNYNADPSDIYSNITESPVFVDLDSSTAIASTSSAINAGDLDSLDLDGTIADIGADFYNYGYAPYRLRADSSGNGSVFLSWTIVATDSLSGYNPYYRVQGADDWIFEPTFATSDQTIEITGLTNNEIYDFAVTAQYLTTESNKSPVLKEKPGIPVMELSPKYLVVEQEAGDSSAVEYTIINNGTKDLVYTAGVRFDLGSVTYEHPQYPDVNDTTYWDIITENVAITRNTNKGLYNPILESSYQRSGQWISPEGTLWAWGATEGNTNNYTYWRSAVNQSGCGNPAYTLRDQNCGIPIMSLYLVEDDLYFDVEWSSDGGLAWGRHGNDARFAYTRTHIVSGPSPVTGTVAPNELDTLSETYSFFNPDNGIYAGFLKVISNDPENQTDSVYTLNIVGPQASLPATNFTPVDTTAEEFYYVITSANIDGYDLETGDEIALFSGAICVGAGMYNGVMPFLVRAFAANPPDDPGFADGDSITVKAWDFGESRVAAMTATLETGGSAFQSGGFSTVLLTGTIYYTQDITIQGGMFNLISYYLYPQNPSSSTLFGDLDGLRIVYEDNGTALIPEYGINTIGDIDLTEGYHLFADGDNQTLTVTGLSIDPADWSITLAPNQFNSIAFLHDGPMDAELAMASIDTLIEIVQDDAGGAWIPAFGATIGNLIPGKGYQVFTSLDTVVSFTYAPYQAPAARSMLAAARPHPAHFSFRRTGAPYTILLQSAVIDGHNLEAGDEVAVYDGDICVGAVVWDPETANILTAWRGDEELELPGYKAGNAMSFQIYKTRFKKMVVVSASFTDETQRMFDGSSYSRVSLRGSPGLIPQQFALEQNYPNPFNPVTTIGYHVAEDAPVTIVIYNLMGQEVVRLLDSQVHAPGKYNIVWQATNHQGENVSAGVYLIHMSSSRFAKTKKMVLLK